MVSVWEIMTLQGGVEGGNIDEVLISSTATATCPRGLVLMTTEG